MWRTLWVFHRHGHYLVSGTNHVFYVLRSLGTWGWVWRNVKRHGGTVLWRISSLLSWRELPQRARVLWHLLRAHTIWYAYLCLGRRHLLFEASFSCFVARTGLSDQTEWGSTKGVTMSGSGVGRNETMQTGLVSCAREGRPKLARLGNCLFLLPRLHLPLFWKAWSLSQWVNPLVVTMAHDSRSGNHHLLSFQSPDFFDLDKC